MQIVCCLKIFGVPVRFFLLASNVLLVLRTERTIRMLGDDLKEGATLFQKQGRRFYRKQFEALRDNFKHITDQIVCGKLPDNQVLNETFVSAKQLESVYEGFRLDQVGFIKGPDDYQYTIGEFVLVYVHDVFGSGVFVAHVEAIDGKTIMVDIPSAHQVRRPDAICPLSSASPEVEKRMKQVGFCVPHPEFDFTAHVKGEVDVFFPYDNNKSDFGPSIKRGQLISSNLQHRCNNLVEIQGKEHFVYSPHMIPALDLPKSYMEAIDKLRHGFPFPRPPLLHLLPHRPCSVTDEENAACVRCGKISISCIRELLVKKDTGGIHVNLYQRTVNLKDGGSVTIRSIAHRYGPHDPSGIIVMDQLCHDCGAHLHTVANGSWPIRHLAAIPFLLQTLPPDFSQILPIVHLMADYAGAWQLPKPPLLPLSAAALFPSFQ